jgi:amidohydrolase
MPLRNPILSAIETHAPMVVELSRRIHAHPELRFEEHQAAAWLTEAVERAGIPVERGLGGMPTAFRARVGRASGPRVAVLAEYDALPEIGHACGHNLIAGGALGAFLGLAAVADQLPGEVVLLGTPAEEGGAGKVKLLEAGAFEGVDAAMMFHPYDRDLLTHPALANEALTFSFSGKPSHAAMAPWLGYSALSGVIQTFNLVDNQRLHFRQGTRVHGIITNGGQAVNIIPEHAECQFSARALSSADLDELSERLVDCARAAALATRTHVTIKRQKGYKEMRNNLALARCFGRHIAALGRACPEATDDPAAGPGSTDMGDVSHAVPSIHPYLAICDAGTSMCHQQAFAGHSASAHGMDTMLQAARSMALTAEEFLRDASLRAAVAEEFQRQRQHP